MLSLVIRTTKENAKENGSVLICLKKCAKKALNLKVEEIIIAFLRDWLETIKPTIAETTYESYSQKLNSVVSYFDTVFPDITLAEVTADVLRAKKEQDEYLSTVLKSGCDHEYEDYIYTDKFGRLITPNYVTDHFANVIKKYKLYQISGVSETHIRDLERGDRNPSFDTLSRLVKPLGLSLAEMFRDSEDVSYLNSNERELVECYRMLSHERAEKLLQFLKMLV